MNYKSKKNLIIGPNINYWDLKKPNLVLGDWCVNKENERVLSKIQYEKLENEIFEEKNISKEIKFCDDIYERLLIELSKELNKTHNIEWDLRTWRVIVGPWLDRYVAILNNRLNLYLKIKYNYNIEFKKINFKEDNLISYDLMDFTNKACSQDWNEKLFRKFFELENKIKFNRDLIENINFKILTKKRKNYLNSFIKFIKYKINRFWNIFPLSKYNNFFFKNIYIGNYYLVFKLFVKLRNFPVKYYTDESREFFNFNTQVRKKLKINYENYEYKEKVIRFLLIEIMPTLYLEGFKKMMQKVKDTNLPTKKINIFTCNCWTDNVFKFWIASSLKTGSKLIYGQHGSAYGMVKEHNALKHELKICDKYLTWGWQQHSGDNSHKIIPCLAFPIIKNKNQKTSSKQAKKEVVIVSTVMDYFLFKNEIRRPDQINKDLDIVSNIINTINPELKKNLSFKPHPIEIKKEKDFSYYDFIKKNYPDMKIYNHKKKLDTITDNSKISIFLYLATPFLTNLALNKPSIMIYQYDFEKTLNQDAQKFFKLLKDNGVVYDNAIEATNFLNENYLNGIEAWWNNSQTRDAIKKFTNYYVKKNINPINVMIEKLKK